MSATSVPPPTPHVLPIRDVELAFVEWHPERRGEGASLLFAHATGFHARCWDPLIRRLGARHAVAVDLRGHGGSSDRAIDDWREIGLDLAALLDRIGLERVVGVGHSMGGHALVDACALRPERFVGLVLFDPVIAPPGAYGGSTPDPISLAEGLAEGLHPTARRRNRFASWQAMFDRFADRRPYAVFDREALRAYCEHGLRPARDGEGLELCCPPTVEASVYASSRTNGGIHDSVAAVRVPTLVVRAIEPRGEREAFDFSVSPTWPGLAARFADGRDLHLPELTHFLPMEDPERLAGLVCEHLERCSGVPAGRHGETGESGPGGRDRAAEASSGARSGSRRGRRATGASGPYAAGAPEIGEGIMPLSRVSQAIEEIERGRAVIMVDDEDRENEGDLVIAAETITPEWVNFMTKHGRGLICLTLTEQRAGELDLPFMVGNNSAPYQTAFTVSIEARKGVTTGISAEDRARTILTAVDPASGPRDLVRPGHVFPIVAREGGVLVRTGHTEGSVDLARLAGFAPAGVICEILNDDGTMARRPDLERFAREFDLKIVSIAELIHYRRAKEKLVERFVEDDLDFVFGRFRTIVYRSVPDGTEHFAFCKGDFSDGSPVLVRVQTAQPIAAFHAELGLPSPIEAPMRRIEAEGRGAIVIIGQPGGGESVGELLKRRALGEESPPTPRGEAEQLRDYGIGAQILSDLGIRKMRLMTNHPRRIVGIEGFDLSVEETVPMQAERPLASVHPIRED